MSSARRWAVVHAGCLIIASLLAFATNSAIPLAVVASISFSAFIIFHQRKQQILRHRANWITSARTIAVCATGLSYPLLNHWTLFAVGVIVLLADFLDGYVARLDGTSSEFGAYLDMETDAFFIVQYAAILWVSDLAGVWVLTLGLLRYLNLVALYLLKQMHKPEPRLYIARVIAVMVMVAVVMPLVAPRGLYLPYLVMTVLLLTASFALTFSRHLLQPEPQILQQ